MFFFVVQIRRHMCCILLCFDFHILDRGVIICLAIFLLPTVPIMTTSMIVKYVVASGYLMYVCDPDVRYLEDEGTY